MQAAAAAPEPTPPAEPATRREAAAAAAEQSRAGAGFARRDFEVIDARRVERADLVRDLLRRRRDAARADARPDGSVPTGPAASGPAAPPSADAAAEPDTAETVALKRDADGRIMSSDDERRAASDRARRSAAGPRGDARPGAGSGDDVPREGGGPGSGRLTGPAPHLRELPIALTGEAPNLNDTIRLSRDPLAPRRSAMPPSAAASPPSAHQQAAAHSSGAAPVAQDASGAAGPADPGGQVAPWQGAPPAPVPGADPAPPTAAIPVLNVPRSPDASPADVSAAAIGILRTWRADAEARRGAVAEAQAQVRTERARDRLDPSGDLRRAVEAPGGREFLRDLLDDVIRPDDHIVAGNGLGDLAQRIPPTLSLHARRAFRLGVVAGPGLPWVAVPVLRRTARAFFARELVAPSSEAESAALQHAADLGAVPRVVALGDRVLGYARATERIRRLHSIVADPRIAEVEFTIADIEPVANLWDLEGTVERIAAALMPLYLAALGGPTTPPTRLMLRATSSRDLEIAVRVFQRVLGEPALHQLEAGISIPAQFPESTGIVRRLAGWAHMRREDFGAPITLGVTRAADIALERVDAVMNGWRLATFTESREVDASVVRLLDTALGADHAGAIRVEVDGDVLRDAAMGIALAAARRGSGAAAPPMPAVGPDGASLAQPGQGGPGAYAGTGMRVVVPLGAGDAAIERLRAVGAEVVQRLPFSAEAGMRHAVPYLLRRVDQEADSVDALELTDATLRGRDAMHPDEERLLDAVGRMFQLPGGANRRQERIDADDAATVTASIQLELFPDGLLDDDAAPLPGVEDAIADGQIPQLAPAPDDAFTPPGAHDAQRPAVPLPGDEPGSAFRGTGPHASGSSDADAAGADDPAANPADTGPSARLTEIVLGLRRGRYLRNTFRAAPGTDPTIPAHREWITRIQRRVGRSLLGRDEAEAARVTQPEQVDALLERAVTAGPAWRAMPGWERAAHLERAAKAIEANRARLVEVAVSEFGVPISDADVDVSRAVDVANHAAHLARQLDRMQGAAFHPVGVSVVLPPGAPPVAGASGGALTALAAGSAVIVKASPKTRRTAGVLAGVLWAAEIPRDLVQLAVIDEDPVSDERLGRRLITDDRVERVLMHGTWESARTLLGWRHDLPLIAGTSGKNAIIVTPAADLDQAAADIARSAFLSTGQRAGHAGTVILVGSVARSTRFLQQLADAVTAFAFGYPSDPGATAGPLVEPADAQLRFALTQLGEGERWLVEPRQLDDTGRLWTPGVKLGVQPGSYSHVTEFFGPVLSVMTALTLDQAIELQNATQYGLVAGLQSHDRAEIGRWIARAQAGTLFVNRDTLGNTVQRQPFGGWRRSSVGTFQKTGGPNGLMALGEWRIDPGQASPTLHLRGMDAGAVRLIEAAQPSLDYEAFDRVRRTALSCQIAWNEEFGEASDVTGLAFERNLLRYVPAAVTVRLAEGAPLEELIRILAGARIVRAVPDISTAQPLPHEVAAALAELQFPARVESDAEFAARVRDHGLDSLRIRLIGGSRRALAAAIGGDPDIAVWSGPVTFAGRVELLPFLREQSISITSHRDGRPDARVDEIFEHERVLDPERPFA